MFSRYRVHFPPSNSCSFYFRSSPQKVWLAWPFYPSNYTCILSPSNCESWVRLYRSQLRRRCVLMCFLVFVVFAVVAWFKFFLFPTCTRSLTPHCNRFDAILLALFLGDSHRVSCVLLVDLSLALVGLGLDEKGFLFFHLVLFSPVTSDLPIILPLVPISHQSSVTTYTPKVLYRFLREDLWSWW